MNTSKDKLWFELYGESPPAPVRRRRHHYLLGAVLLGLLFGGALAAGRGDGTARADTKSAVLAQSLGPVKAMLPQVGGPGSSPTPSALPAIALPTVLPSLKPAPSPVASSIPHAAKPTSGLLAGKEVGGWLLSGNEQNWAYLTGSLFPFTTVSPFWFALSDDGKSVGAKQTSIPYTETVRRAHAGGLTVWPTVTGNPDTVRAIIKDPAGRGALVVALVSLVKQTGADGIDIDFELLGKDDSPYFLAFLGSLSQQLHKSGGRLSVVLEARINNEVAMDWPAIGKLADKVEIMIYDYHSRVTGEPGAIAPIGWVREVAAYARQTLPTDKTFLAFGAYGYDWAPAADGGSYSGQGLTYADVSALLAEKAASIEHSSGVDERGYEVGLSPRFSYVDTAGGGALHEVWYEDADSLKEKLAETRDFAGVYFWRLGAEDSSLWSALRAGNSGTVPTQPTNANRGV